MKNLITILKVKASPLRLYWGTKHMGVIKNLKQSSFASADTSRHSYQFLTQWWRAVIIAQSKLHHKRTEPKGRSSPDWVCLLNCWLYLWLFCDRFQLQRRGEHHSSNSGKEPTTHPESGGFASKASLWVAAGARVKQWPQSSRGLELFCFKIFP